MELIAHRGFAARHPENTLRAARSAAERADWVEVDVRRSADGEPVVIHDATVDRATDATGPVGDHAAAALAELSVVTPARACRRSARSSTPSPTASVSMSN
ncbi:hypothetical protein BRD13_07380 [Halobacteriales archaeon SW_5_70_135]|nr:MAG: hypothetical protein BRD13_07380 [Halobacteriales archaeon SW_5_70_135]